MRVLLIKVTWTKSTIHLINKKMKIPQRITVSHWDVEELMARMLGKLDEYENDEIEDLEDEFLEKFEIDSDQFKKVVEHLMPYTVLSKSELSDDIRIGFVDHEKSVYVIKENVTV